MPAPHYYPRRLPARIAWHASFAAQAAEDGTAYGLSAADVAQIQLDAANVQLVVEWSEAVDAHRQAVTAFRDGVLSGERRLPVPTPPTAPAGIAFAPGSLQGIMERTRRFVAVVKSSQGYTQAVGESYGIVPPERGGFGVPSLVALALPGGSVRLRIAKAGFVVLAVDCRRGGGEWEQIGVSQRAVYVDTRPPLVPGQPEQREYRVQGLLKNSRIGSLSDAASVVTVP